MPRIGDKMLHCTFYVYPTKEAAEDGKPIGGCGFFVAIQSSRHANIAHVFAVTNKHVVDHAGNPVLTMNTSSGAKEIVQTYGVDWVFHQDGENDLAICHVDMDFAPYQVHPVSASTFLTQDMMRERDIGPGDEVFMVGRFINHQGSQRNLPTARFGHLAMMPLERVKLDTGTEQEAFLVETHSLPGYSGSPVFVYIPGWDSRSRPEPKNASWLLGIDCGHIYYDYHVQNSDGSETPGKMKIKANTGMAAIIPAWRLAEILEYDEVAMAIKKVDNAISRRSARASLD